MAQLGEDGSPILVLRGPPSHRAEAYGWLRQTDFPVMGRDGWLGVGALADFAFHISRLGGDWSLLWGLCDVQEFVVDEPLRGMIDEGSRYTELFRALWEVRFLLDEGNDVRPFVRALTRWMVEGQLSEPLRQLRIESEPNQQERADLLLFLLTLARQNSLTGPLVFVFDSLERAVQQRPETRQPLLKGLLTLVEAVDRWAPLGSPAGLLIGMPNQRKTLSRLRRHNVRLHRRLRDHGV
jgi:hypothetical protein